MIYENGNEPEFSLTAAILPAGARLIGKTRARTTRYCLQVMEKIRELEMKMSPHGLRPFSSTSWVAWMVGSVNLSRSLDSW